MPIRATNLLDRIYDAALEDSGFTRLGGLLAQSTNSANGVVVVRKGMMPVQVATTTPSEAQQAYLDYYGFIDPWARMALVAPHWKVVASAQQISDRELLSNEFYVDYARPLDIYNPLGATCTLSSGLTLTIGVNRTRAAPSFSAQDKRHLLDLLKHLQRALQLRSKFDALQTQANAGLAALDALAFGVIVTDAAGGIVLANAEAEASCRSGVGLVLRASKVSAVRASENAVLIKLIADAAAGGPGGAFKMTDVSGDSFALGLVARLPRRFDPTSEGRGRALIAFRRGNGSHTFMEQALTALFGLSPAESQLVRAITEGASLEVFAARRGVKISTVKTQLEHVFRKTGTQSQRELLRIIGALPPIR